MSSFSTGADITLNYDGSTFIIDSNPLSAPLTIINTSGSQVTVTLDFSATIANATHYVVVGSSLLTFEGQNRTINASTSTFRGLLVNNNASYANVIVQNLRVAASGSGALTGQAGWICQSHFNNGTVINCGSTGNVAGASTGGIYGALAVSCTASNCVASGNITGSGAGGIYGAQSVNCIATNCASTGNMSNGSGGIFGSLCDMGIADGCGSWGTIGNVSQYNCGGLFGPSGADCQALNCFALGSIYGDLSGSNGGLFGNGCNNTSAIKCFTLGTIGVACGGIFFAGSNNSATQCYTLGLIQDQAGGVFSGNCANCTATSCYTVGDIGDQSGGVFGPDASACSASQCYTLGAVTNGTSGSLIGANAINSACTDCYVLNGTNFFGSGGSSNVITNCISEDGSPWSDTNAASTIANDNTEWFSTAANSPYLLSAFDSYGSLTPTGFQASYTIPALSTITSNGVKVYTLLTGYYASQPPTDNPPNPMTLYGYVLTAINIDVLIASPPQPSMMNAVSIPLLCIACIAVALLAVALPMLRPPGR